MKLTSTGADGTFSIPSIASGRHILQIITRDLGAKELAVAFANPVINAKDDAPVAVEIRPLPTVDLTLDARVLRGKVEFPDFELWIRGTLPGHVGAWKPESSWARQEPAKLIEGKYTIAIPKDLAQVTVQARPIYMRKGDVPAFIWRREGVEKREVGNTFALGVADKAHTVGLTVQDAAMLDIQITSPDGKKLVTVKLTGSAECEAWGTLALDDWSQLNFPDHSKGEANFPACERATFTITADGYEPLTQEVGMIKPGEKKEVRVASKAAAKSVPAK